MATRRSVRSRAAQHHGRRRGATTAGESLGEPCQRIHRCADKPMTSEAHTDEAADAVRDALSTAACAWVTLTELEILAAIAAADQHHADAVRFASGAAAGRTRRRLMIRPRYLTDRLAVAIEEARQALG